MYFYTINHVFLHHKPCIFLWGNHIKKESADKKPLSKDKIQILLVDDHAIVRQGFKGLINALPDLEVVGEADNGYQAVRRIMALKPDLVFLDLSLPEMNGIGVLNEVKRQTSPTKFIVLTAHNTDEYVHACFDAGAKGYVSKAAGFDEIEFAIRTVLDGKTFISPEISSTVIDGYLSGKKEDTPSAKMSTLTKRERQILKLIAKALRTREIAIKLFISPATVERHRANIMKKLDLHNASALTSFAIQNRLI